MAMLLAELPEADAAEALEQLWAVAGVEPIGGRTAGEIVQRLAARARDARRAAPDVRSADLIEQFPVHSRRPRPRPGGDSALGREAGADLSRQIAVWRARAGGARGGGVPPDGDAPFAAFGRAFGYYDGFLFEVRSAALSAEAAGGGGRALRQSAAATQRPDRRQAVAPIGGAAGCIIRPWRAWAGGAG